MPENWATIPDWSEKQHYKNRKAPPWIKLHKELLDSYRFQCLPLASKALAPQIWLLASEKEGRVRIDVDYLHFRLHWDKDDLRVGLKALIDNGYLILDSNVLATCKQDDTPEREEEEEENKKEAKASSSTSVDGDVPTSDENVSRETIAEALRSYRDMARDVGLPKPHGTERQRKLMRARLKERGLQGWHDALAKIRGSPFLQGKAGRDGWTGATLDWMCKLANFEKILDGNYDGAGDKRNNEHASIYERFLNRGEATGDVENLRPDGDYPENCGDAGGEPVSHLRLAHGR